MKITLLLDTLLPAHPIFWDDALGLGLKAFFALELPNIAQASRLAPPAIQTRCLLRVPTLVGRVRAGWGLDFHLDDAVRIENFHRIVATPAPSWYRGPDEGGDEKSQGRRLAQAIQDPAEKNSWRTKDVSRLVHVMSSRVTPLSLWLVPSCATRDEVFPLSIPSK